MCHIPPGTHYILIFMLSCCAHLFMPRTKFSWTHYPVKMLGTHGIQAALIIQERNTCLINPSTSSLAWALIKLLVCPIYTSLRGLRSTESRQFPRTQFTMLICSPGQREEGQPLVPQGVINAEPVRAWSFTATSWIPSQFSRK